MQLRFGTLAVAALAALTCACGSNSSSTSPTPTSQSTSTVVTTPAAPSLPPTASVSDPGGEWNLATPAGLPRGGCISLDDIPGKELDWTVQAVTGHPHRILMQGLWRWESVPSCDPLAPGGDLTRSLQIAGGGWTFLANEPGTRTIAWPTQYCADDGGRFEIDVQVERDVPSVGNGDREAVQLLVNCGFSK
jgi:hypothetical protein